MNGTIDTDAVRSDFLDLYGREPRLFWAPGRVNLIGEHTDYNDGFVLPMAINAGTIVAAARREDRVVRVRSANLEESAAFDLDRPGEPVRHIWLDYVEGMARSLEETGLRLAGADLLIQSEVPLGAGLSSSAALEISVGLALLGTSRIDLDRRTLALAGQQSEHNYVGIKCGIMDQYIASLGRAGHALLIDCRSLESNLIPMNLEDVAVVVCDTRVKHALASSEYNLRREQCNQGVAILREVLPHIKSLRDVSTAEFEPHQDRLPELIRNRCRHVVTENARTLAAAEALKAGDLKTMGGLMYESHKSLDRDYEVSSPELNLLVEIASSLDGVIGSRMTGGGFGGCTVNLIERDRIETFSDVVSRKYESGTGKAPLVYVFEAGDGARELFGNE
jgi:galactokinase